MKTFIILQNIVTFRADWNKLIDKKEYTVCLLTGKQGWSNLPADQKDCFDDIKICDPYTTEILEKTCRELFVQRQITDMTEVKIITNDEYFLGHAARLRETFGIQGATFAQIEPFINKLRMKAVMTAGNIEIPRVIPFSPQDYQSDPDGYQQQAELVLSYPIFAKQIDSAGSERIAKIQNRHDFRQWCDSNPNVTNYELDEFIEGTLFHIDTIVYNGKIADIYICQYSNPNADFIDGQPVGSLPLDKENPLYSRFEEYNSRVFDALGYVPDGATHLETFLTKDDRIVFLEIAARAPGGWIPQMHALNSGRNIEEQHFLAQMGMLSTTKDHPFTDIYAAWVWYPHREGASADIEKVIHINSAYKVVWEVPQGTPLVRPQSVRDRIGGILLWNDSLVSLTTDFQWLVNDYMPYHDAISTNNETSR